MSPSLFLSDFVSIQRKSFFDLLQTGLIEEFQKRNPITSAKKDIELFFYPEYYKLTRPELSLKKAMIQTKSYSSKIYIPVQLTDKIRQKMILKWVLIGHLPLMTKRGHFLVNGSARIIVNQILRSPGIYFHEKIYEIYSTKWSEKPVEVFKRYYADLICLKGTWLRLELDKEKVIWAQMKKGPKIPILWLLIGMGLTERTLFGTLFNPNLLLLNHEKDDDNIIKYKPVQYPSQAWRELYLLTSSKVVDSEKAAELGRKWLFKKFMNPRTYDMGKQGRFSFNKKLGLNLSVNQTTLTAQDLLYATDALMKVEKGLKKTDDIDHLKNRRVRTSGELLQIQIGTGLMRLEKTIREKLNKNDFFRFSSSLSSSSLILNSGGGKSLPTLSNLTNLPQRSSFPLSFDKGMEKNRVHFFTTIMRQKPLSSYYSPVSLASLSTTVQNGRLPILKDLHDIEIAKSLSSFALFSKEVINQSKSRFTTSDHSNHLFLAKSQMEKKRNQQNLTPSVKVSTIMQKKRSLPVKAILAIMQGKNIETQGKVSDFSTIFPIKNLNVLENKSTSSNVSLNYFINTKPFNGALKEFFGSSQLSQYMDQINPLAEMTHKRRLTSLGPGGVSRDTATLAIRGIHPTHYGRICPIETPEGKNTGLVNSMTTYAKVNSQGFLLTPFYKLYKGQVQENLGLFFLSAEQEEKMKIAAADVHRSKLLFLPKVSIPIRIAEDFTKMTRKNIDYVGVSPIQMISIATSLIPFFEHDDANRALMGSNMQRQAVPVIRPERPIVGTGLEARAASDSGHVVQADQSGFVGYASGKKIVMYTFVD